MLKGIDNRKASKEFALNSAQTRGNSLKLVKPGYHLDCHKFSFSQRVTNTWNSLMKHVVA